MSELDQKALEAAANVIREGGSYEEMARLAVTTYLAALPPPEAGAGEMVVGYLTEQDFRAMTEGKHPTGVVLFRDGSTYGSTPLYASPDTTSIIDVLIEARNQIEYLHGKFQETGSGNAVIAKLDDLRHKLQAKP
jgi:hypothetical protein